MNFFRLFRKIENILPISRNNDLFLLRRKTDNFSEKEPNYQKTVKFVEKPCFPILKNKNVNEYLETCRKNMADSQIRTRYLWDT